MEQPSFHPNAQKVSDDKVSKALKSISQFILLFTLGVLPIAFLPIAFLPFMHGKVLLVMAGVVLAVFFYVLHVLREGSYTIQLPLAYLALWLLAGVSVVSALVSGDVRDGVVGDYFGVHTAGFMVLLAFIVSSIGVLKNSKIRIMQLYTVLIGSSVVLSVYHVARILFGADFVSLNVFNTGTSSPFGGWNDLALFFGLVVLLSVLAMAQLPLSKAGKAILWVVSISALLMLSVINFFAVWVVLAVVSCVVLVYNLTQHRNTNAQLPLDESKNDGLGIIILTTVIAIVSVLFVIMGPSLGGFISNMTKISYVEVRPSMTATLDIARSVYRDDLVIGTGPNKFVDAWRLYKDPAINETLFWNTNFRSGSSYITTSLVELGLLGLVTWVTFLGLLLFSGFKMLFRSTPRDNFWRFIGVSSFVSSLYLWTMAALYVPGATILMLAAVCTGIFLVSYQIAVPVRSLSVSVRGNRNVAFMFVAVSILLIVGMVSSLYIVGKNSTSAYIFNKALASIEPGDTIDVLEAQIATLYNQTENDVFARQIALYELAQIRALLALPEPNEQERQAFQTAVTQAVSAAQAAYKADRTDATNSLVLGQIYSVLASIGVEGAYDRAVESVEEARSLDPQNAAISLLRAQIEGEAGKLSEAREFAEEALSLRSRYTEAINLLTQIDITEGDVPAAIERTRSLLSLEPANPVRWYQLAVLLINQNDRLSGITALREAVRLDTNYANAHYLLGLQLALDNQTQEAIEQLKVVRDLNPANQVVTALIEELQNGTATSTTIFASQIEEPQATGDVAPKIVSPESIESNLISPVNTVPSKDAPAASTTANPKIEE